MSAALDCGLRSEPPTHGVIAMTIVTGSGMTGGDCTVVDFTAVGMMQ
jgi:hypothetical protein